MINSQKALWIILSGGLLLFTITVVYLLCYNLLALPFRETNDMLHETKSPVTLDFLIPGGFYIDQKVTIGDVVQRRFQKPGNRLTLLFTKISETIPAKYRYTGTCLWFLLWTFLFMFVFRVFTWMSYAFALRISFLCGAVVYFFLPDLVVGRMDDAAFLTFSVVLLALTRWFQKTKATSTP